MKTIEEFLLYLDSLNIKFRVDGDRLYCNAPQGVLSPELSTQLRERKQEILTHLTSSLALLPIVPVPRNANLPLSFAQQRLWFLNQLEPNSTTYNLPFAVRLTGTLNVPALERSLNEIVQRHEALRTTFAIANGQPIQVITPTLTLKLSVVDLQEYSITKQETEVLRLAVQESQSLFNLAQGPLLRTTLLHLSEQQYVLLLTMHHIVSDGWSIGLLIKEVTALYEAFCKGQPSPLSELPIQYADFAAWQQNWLQGEVLNTLLTYWKKQLGDNLPVLQLPIIRQSSEMKTSQEKRQNFILSQTLSQAIKKLGDSVGTTLFMTLLGAFKVLLYWYTGDRDIVVGTDIANRNRIEIENLIGFFVNQLVLRTNLSDNPTFSDLLQRVRKVCLEAYAHQDLPFEKLVGALNPKRDFNQTPLFQVKLILQNAPIHSLELSELTLTSLDLENQVASVDLLLELTDTEQGIVGLFKYNKDLFDASSITRLINNFKTILSQIIIEPTISLNQLEEMIIKSDKEYQLSEERKHKEKSQQKLSTIKRKAIAIEVEK
ncbi:MAG: condensation domain-containing protein [Nostoc sp. DedQUE08]|uniref:condensation domain-containing protein n=1 Tax=Nostoc sp. DedQUE08 TaxID=3075393 RepID=UPI002AD3D892|nr:condensation domain-containing protein [Nostoc sp. DedQUE08]MDZ8067342.1 condensation domain-containing protein [Nostoc sp. DedQUE08]